MRLDEAALSYEGVRARVPLRRNDDARSVTVRTTNGVVSGGRARGALL